MIHDSRTKTTELAAPDGAKHRRSPPTRHTRERCGSEERSRHQDASASRHYAGTGPKPRADAPRSRMAGNRHRASARASHREPPSAEACHHGICGIGRGPARSRRMARHGRIDNTLRQRPDARALCGKRHGDAIRPTGAYYIAFGVCFESEFGSAASRLTKRLTASRLPIRRSAVRASTLRFATDRDSTGAAAREDHERRSNDHSSRRRAGPPSRHRIGRP